MKLCFQTFDDSAYNENAELPDGATVVAAHHEDHWWHIVYTIP